MNATATPQTVENLVPQAQAADEPPPSTDSSTLPPDAASPSLAPYATVDSDPPDVPSEPHAPLAALQQLPREQHRPYTAFMAWATAQSPMTFRELATISNVS